MMQCEVVVSCENNPYIMWQAMLFHYSCMKHLSQAPVFVVHTDDEKLLHGFERIRRKGGQVQTAQNYRRVDGVNYPPRNTAATLRHVRTDAELIMLCDPDMVFVATPNIPFADLTENTVSFDRLDYLHTDDKFYRPLLEQVCEPAGVPFEWLVKHPINGGVPYLVPSGLKDRISDDWLHCMSLFPTHAPAAVGPEVLQIGVGRQQHWLTVMWSIVLTMYRLEIDVQFTRYSTHNYADRPLPDSAAGYSMIHYCYPTDSFDKRTYDTLETADSSVWNAEAAAGSASELVCQQLREACEYFDM